MTCSFQLEVEDDAISIEQLTEAQALQAYLFEDNQTD